MNPTLAEIFAAYLEDVDARQIAAPHSVKSHFKQPLAHFGAMPIDEFNKGVKHRMLRYAAHRRDVDGIKDSTINREIRNIKTALNYAEREELIDRGQNKWLPKPAQSEPRSRVLSHEPGGELDRFVANLHLAPKHYSRFARIDLLTGQRKSAVLQLRREHVEFFKTPRLGDDGGLCFGTLWYSRTQTKKTKKKRQDQPISEDLREVIEECLADMAEGCDYLIQFRGRQVKDVRVARVGYLKRIGITERFVIHDIRRTVAQTVRDETNDLGGTASLLGNTEAQCNSTYARPKVDRNLRPMGVMAAKMARARSGSSAVR